MRSIYHALDEAFEPTFAPDGPTGYLHPGYAASLAEFGTPRALPRSGGWILERRVPGSDRFDAMGTYPILACDDWAGLADDLDELDGLVSLTVVTDPFGDYDVAHLRRCFPDLCVPFKEHFVFDLTSAPLTHVSRHHRKEARQALRKLTMQEHPDPPAFLDEWMRLHAHLIARHHICGIRAFSREAFAQQLLLPGAKVTTASYEGRTVGAIIWLIHDHVAYGHVQGVDELGRRLGANYALYWFALEHFTQYADWINVAGVPGAIDAGAGLAQFKRGWTQDTRTAYICGRVFDREAYARLVRAAGTEASRYFPAYRAGEMA